MERFIKHRQDKLNKINYKIKDNPKLVKHKSTAKYSLYRHILRHSIKDELHIKGIRLYQIIPTNIIS